MADASLEPRGFPSLPALLAYANWQGWLTFTVGIHPPQTALLTLRVSHSGIGQGRLWLHLSAVSTSPMAYAKFVPARFLGPRAGPAMAIADARLTGFSYVEIVREPPAIVAGSTDYSERARREFDEAFLADVQLPKLDGSSKETSYMNVTIAVEGMKYTSRPATASQSALQAALPGRIVLLRSR